VNLALDASVLLLNLAVFGAHARFPFVVAAASESSRRAWALAAAPALLGSLAATAATLARQPDEAIAWGMTGPFAESTPARILALTLLALLVADLVVAFGWRRLEPDGWRIVGVLGVLGCLAYALGADLLRIGWGPAGGLALILLGAALRLPLVLAGAELMSGPPGVFTLVAGPALALAFTTWPGELRHSLRADLPTLVAAVALLAAARFTPARLRRMAAMAGLLLAVLFLARAGERSSALGLRETLPASLLTQ
jgi:hypothetical protein